MRCPRIPPGFASLVAILVTLAGCHNRDRERMTAIRDAVCACKTTSCAEQALETVSKQPIKSDHKTQELARDMIDCVAKLQAAEQPSTDPDREELPAHDHDHAGHDHAPAGSGSGSGAP